MKPLHLLLSASVLGCLAGCQSSSSPGYEPDAELVERLHADVAWLADDARQGRRAGTTGERAAADWIAARFAELGVEPAGEGGGYLQAFQVPLTASAGEANHVVVGGERIDAAPLFCSAAGRALGPLVDAGHGIVLAERGHDDYAGLDVAGAVVLLRRGTPESRVADGAGGPGGTDGTGGAGQDDPHGGAGHGGSGWGGSGSIFHKVMEAKRRGAVAVVLGARSADEPLLRFDPGRSGEAGIPALAVSYQDFEALRARDATAEVSADVRRGKGEATNVLGRVRGGAPGPTVVVGAHFDHLGLGGSGSLARDSFGEVHNGADDNASGTAVVLELARRYAAQPPARGDVVFALWSGEELGLLGSEHWMARPTLPLDAVAANLNLDMVGRAGDGGLQVLGAGTAGPFTGWLEAEGPAAGLSLSINASGQGVGGSDHQSFLKREIPALHFFSGVHTDYHKPSDDIDGFEAAGAGRVSRLAKALVDRMLAASELAWVEPPAPEERASGERVGGFRSYFGSVPEYSHEGPGMLLAGTSAGGPAERAGFLAGDLIVKIADIEIESIYDFMFSLNAHKPGDVVLVRFERDGEELETRVTLGSRELE